MTFKLLLTFCGVAVTHALLAQQSFPTPEDAGHALVTAVENDQLKEITKILGVSEKLVFPNSSKEDHPDCEMFVQKYKEMHRFHKEPNGKVMLYIGAENWPFPIPLEAKNGAWQFDPKAGEREILYRRVGANEMAAIDACHKLVDPEKKKDEGLAGVSANVPDSAPVLINGYYFRAIVPASKKAQPPSDTGKLEFIAYPAEYRSSGVMTFVVTPKNVVYEKDLGPGTAKVASHMTEFHQDPSWYPADQSTLSAK
jgi:hypothetical protein